jgi:predicted lysophospholipase L1 biosynthesis ABC-type transport system permease subunit
MDRKVSTRFAIGAIATLGLISIVLSIVTLSGLWSQGSGDLLVSPAMANGMNLALLVGSIVILGLEFAHVRRLRRRHAPVRQARSPFKP